MRMGRLTDEGQAGAAAAAAGASAARAAAPPRDEVDDLIAAWRSERPDLDVAPLQVLSRVSRLARHLDLARRASFASHGLETWEWDVLSALRRQGAPYQMTPGALLRATLVTSGTMTNRIDRLAEAGLVRRQPDPRDRRGGLVTLTDLGPEKADAALAHPPAPGAGPARLDRAGRPADPGPAAAHAAGPVRRRTGRVIPAVILRSE